MRTVDSVAREICLAAGRLVTPIDGADRHSLISDLWTPHQSQLGGLTAFQLEAEFDYVLIGRDVSTLDEYRQLSRSGRGTALQPAAREVVWRIYGDYRKALTRQGLTSWHEMRRDALEALRAGEVTKGGFQRTSQR